jgi:hypothetical protein
VEDSGNRQSLLYVIYYVRPPEKSLPGSDRAGNIHDHLDVILDARVPKTSSRKWRQWE